MHDGLHSSSQRTASSRRYNSSSHIPDSNVTKESLKCAEDLVAGLGPKHCSKYINALIDDMFESGLTVELIESLQSISACLPPQEQALIEERLLQELSICLAGTPFAY